MPRNRTLPTSLPWHPKAISLTFGLLQWCLAFCLHAETVVTLPQWSELVMELPPALVVKIQVERSSGKAAESRLLPFPDALQPRPDDTLYHLRVETRLKWFLSSKSWLGELWLQPDLTALQRTRLKSGRSRNYKIYRYARDKVYRVRQSPADEQKNVPPDSWPLENKRIYAFPPGLASRCIQVSDPYALLMILPQQAFEQNETLCIFNKQTVYEVTLQRQGVQDLEVSYRIDGKNIRTTVKAEKIAILPRPIPLDTGWKPEPFELLGMEGDVVLLRDKDRHLPLQFEGKVPGFGKAKLRLTQVRLRPAPSPH